MLIKFPLVTWTPKNEHLQQSHRCIKGICFKEMLSLYVNPTPHQSSKMKIPVQIEMSLGWQ